MTGFFGELYLRSTRPLFTSGRTAREADYLAKSFANLPPGPILDVGCGHGRHAVRLGADPRIRRLVVGLERDALSLKERERTLGKSELSFLRGDFRSMGFTDRAFAAAYAWYSTLFVGTDAENERALHEVARCLRPGGIFIFHTVPYEHLAQNPRAVFQKEYPDGSRVDEESTFDPKTGRDNGFRRMTLPDGRVLSAHYFIRYYPRAELRERFAANGLTVKWEHGSLDGTAPERLSAELIVGAERNG